MSGPPSIEDGRVFFETKIRSKEEPSIRVVDDLNVRGKTLAARRLRLLKYKEYKLYEFNTACFFLSDMVKLSTRSEDHWIDSSGKIFRNLKLSTYKVEKRKILRAIQQVGHVLIEVEGEASRFKSLYGPTSSEQVALILVKGAERIFYGFSYPEIKVKRRKV